MLEASAVSFVTDHSKLEVSARRSALRAQPVLGDNEALARLVAKRKRLQHHSRVARKRVK